MFHHPVHKFWRFHFEQPAIELKGLRLLHNFSSNDKRAYKIEQVFQDPEPLSLYSWITISWLIILYDFNDENWKKKMQRCWNCLNFKVWRMVEDVFKNSCFCGTYSYLIFVIFFTLALFEVWKFYTQKCITLLKCLATKQRKSIFCEKLQTVCKTTQCV